MKKLLACYLPLASSEKGLGPVVPLTSVWLLLTALLMQSSTDGRFARLNSTLAALQALFGPSSASSSSSQRSLERTALLVEILASFALFSLVHFWL